MRTLSKLAPGWWDYTTLDKELLNDTREELFLAEALEYIDAWQQASDSEPSGICGPIGPTEQLPLVARLVNELNISLKNCHFWGMDEWIVEGKEASLDFPLGFARADMESRESIYMA